MITIGERIKELRKQKKISQAELAKNINVSAGNVGDWERGKAKPGADAIISLIQYFSVSADWLLTGNSKNSTGQNINLEHNLDITRKNIDPDTLSLNSEERSLILAFRSFDEFSKDLLKDTVNSLLKHLEKSSMSDSYTSGDDAVKHA